MAEPPASRSESTRLRSAFSARGVPLTVQRRAVYEALAGRRDHPTADEVYAGVQGKVPGISRTTVYRVLEALVRLGLVGKVSHPGAAVRYDPITERHHHLVCLACDRVEDLDREVKVPVPKIGRDGFEISDYSIYFRGLCRDCRKKQKRRDAP
jgi:Fur family peroxide stress response transcriptional regulator